MARRNIPGRSVARNNAGVLKVKGAFLRVPYKILRSRAFLDLEPLAHKIYFILLSRWSTHEPDKPVKMSYKEIRDKAGHKWLDGRYTKPGYTQVRKALTQLEVEGFIIPERQHKQTVLYWIEQKWFTGEWNDVDW